MDYLSGKFSRRSFLQGLVISSASLTHVPLLQGSTREMTPSYLSKVVRVTNTNATDGTGNKDNANLNTDVIREMVNTGIIRFTGKSSIAEAWTEIIPDPTKKVAIKINCQISGIYTKAEVVKAVTEGLLLRGVQPSNIIIYDLTDNAFSFAGFTKNLGSGIKVGTIEELGGYSLTTWFGSPLSNARQRLCKVLAGEGKYGCDYLINIPVQKALDGFSGVSISMKNHFGSISNPSGLHATIQESIAALNAHDQITSKTRLILMDAIFTEYKWVNGRSQEYVDTTNQLVFGTDPVAIDFLGWQTIEKLRQLHGLQAITPEPTFIKIASQKFGLGNYEMEKISLIDI
jgi:hypothetical protein